MDTVGYINVVEANKTMTFRVEIKKHDTESVFCKCTLCVTGLYTFITITHCGYAV